MINNFKNNKMKKILLSAALIAVSFTSFAQVGVGTTSPEGALDVVSTDNGFLMPRMADEAAVTTPVEGMQVYNTTTKKVMLYDGTQWVAASGSTGKFVDGTDPLNAVYMGGKVGIGTTNPERDLTISSFTPRIGLEDTNSAFDSNSYAGLIEWKDALGNPAFSFGDNSGTSKNLSIGNSMGTNARILNRINEVTLTTLLENGNFGIGTTTPGAKLSVVGLVEYADNAAAISAGLTAGDFYRTADGTVKVVF